MPINPELINLWIPLVICLLSALPFLFIPNLAKKENESKDSSYYSVICYLLLLGLIILVFVISKSIEIMSVHNGNRALFVCAILLVACIDRIIDLWSKLAIKTSLINRLQYFVILLCSIPIIWQLLIHLIPSEISGKTRIMSAAEILLMFIMLTLGIINRPHRKNETAQNSEQAGT